MTEAPPISAALSKELKKLAAEIHADGKTREQVLAELIWKYALGWTESIRQPDGTILEVKQKPVQWAMELVFERCEGKPQQAAVEDAAGTIKAKDRVAALAVERVNRLAALACGERPTGVESTAKGAK